MALLVILGVGLLLLAACTGPQGPQGPAGPQGSTGDQGISGTSPTTEQLRALVEEVVSGPAASATSIARGGRLYDNWYEESDLSEPITNQPLWATQTTNTRSGAITWRCKECHGWDYKGIGGKYGSGSHKTGFPGIAKAVATMTKTQLMEVLQGSTNFNHDFSGVIADEDLEALADFLKEGLVNDTIYIDYATSTPIGADVSHGNTLYDSTCAACHGANGKQIDFGGGEYVGTVATDNPWEFLHKVRVGQPGTAMPGAIASGWSLQDVLDVLGYAQTLPSN